MWGDFRGEMLKNKRAGKIPTLLFDGGAKSPPHGVAAIFKISTYHMYAFILEKTLRLVGRNFCLAI